MGEGGGLELGDTKRQKTNHEHEDTKESLEMELKERARASWGHIPGGVVEKIVCGMPFPEVFKARALNKEWCSKFEDVIGANQVSHKWPSYCPAFVSAGEIIGFHRASNRWHTMKLKTLHTRVSCPFSRSETKFKTLHTRVSHPFSPGEMYYERQTLAGPLLCVVEGGEIRGMATVVNLLTEKCRTIICPNLQGWFTNAPVLKMVGAQGFQIVMRSFARDTRARDTLAVAVYSSWSDSWVERSHSVRYCVNHGFIDHGFFEEELSEARHAYLDGTIYWCEGVMDERLDIYEIRVFLEEDSLSPWRKPESDTRRVDDNCLQDSVDPLIKFTPHDKKFLKDFNIYALRCGQKTILTLIMYYKYGRAPDWTARVKVYQFVREALSSNLIELSENKPIVLLGLPGPKLDVLGDKDCVYLCGKTLTSFHLEYITWTCHRAIPAAAYEHPRYLKQCVNFEPGLNPFMLP